MNEDINLLVSHFVNVYFEWKLISLKSWLLSSLCVLHVELIWLVQFYFQNLGDEQSWNAH